MEHERETTAVSVHKTFNAIEAEVAILLDSIRAVRDDEALLAFCERAAEDDSADSESDRAAAAVALHDPALDEAFARVRHLLVAVTSI
jgi:hypothetical protein